ncbi:alcohol dehydrogenase [Trichoderma arundinaceum]|uniref:Alcohol dehydrogenase n=1 Tax=Trichoderma arundinaceum TaxID=490622 RepID=A0A395NRQ9_TRIAR|nr:alcohol dehydrogenase [Trichoderma arundinaceum]
MRSLVAPQKGRPEGYEVRELPVPSMTLPTHVLIRVHAAGMNTGELQALNGAFGFLYMPKFPAQIGMEGSGVVVAVGSGVKTLKVGDEVYGAYIEKPLFRRPPTGFASDYAVSDESFLLRKPSHLSFDEVAGLSTVVLTSYQTWRRALQLAGEESLEGKTVYISAGLSSTGSMAAQVAKKVLGAARVITTVSTPKVPLVERHLPGIFDQVIDYKTQRLRDEVPLGSVDFMYNTQWATLDEGIPLLKRGTGVLISIASVPRKETVREMLGADRFKWWMGLVLDLAQLVYKWKLRGTGVKYEMVSGSLEIREDLERAGEIVALGKVRPVMRVAGLEDMEAVRKGCDEVVTGKGGVGKMIVKIVPLAQASVAKPLYALHATPNRDSRHPPATTSGRLFRRAPAATNTCQGPPTRLVTSTTGTNPSHSVRKLNPPRPPPILAVFSASSFFSAPIGFSSSLYEALRGARVCVIP